MVPLFKPFLTQFLIFKLFKLCAVTGCVASGSFRVLVLWAPVQGFNVIFLFLIFSTFCDVVWGM